MPEPFRRGRWHTSTSPASTGPTSTGPGRLLTAVLLALAAALALPALLACDGGAPASRTEAPATEGGSQPGDAPPATGPPVPVPEARRPRPQAIVRIPGHGELEIELLPDVAPAAVAEFERLARAGFYDGTTFHRVVPGFMIQGGDPLSRDRDPRNDGTGGADEELPDEFSPISHLPGVVALANAGRPGSAHGQFFIMIGEDRSLDGHYTIFGHLVEGLDVARSVAAVERDRWGRHGPPDRPVENVVIESVRIVPPEVAAETSGGAVADGTASR